MDVWTIALSTLLGMGLRVDDDPAAGRLFVERPGMPRAEVAVTATALRLRQPDLVPPADPFWDDAPFGDTSLRLGLVAAHLAHDLGLHLGRDAATGEIAAWATVELAGTDAAYREPLVRFGVAAFLAKTGAARLALAKAREDLADEEVTLLWSA